MCLICERVKLSANKANPYLIKEYKHSYFVLGDHSFFKGYCLLLFKEHETDITKLEPLVQQEFFLEVMDAGKTLQKVFSPDRLNYSCLGNVENHIHYHIFPRYHDELERADKKDPWASSHLFNTEEFLYTEAEVKKVVDQIKTSC